MSLFKTKKGFLIYCLSLGFLSITSVFISIKIQANNKKPNIVILATGGTIAGVAQEKTAVAGYTAGKIGIQTLIDAVPEAKSIANLSGEQVVSIDSQDMNEQIWIKLANKINNLLSKSSVDGVVVTHGTDTLEETAYFLNLNVKSSKPVVVVGSMRPATAISADGPLNLYNAVKVAVSKESRGKGVLVAMNDSIFNSRNVTKTNTSRVDTFKDPFLGPIGFIQNGKVVFYSSVTRLNTSNSSLAIDKSVKSLPRVDIIYAFAGITNDYVDHVVKMGAKGVVVAGMGDGGLGIKLTQALSKAQKQGLVVVRSSRTGTGIVTRNGDAKDDALHFITADNLNPQKARVLLQLALLKTHNDKAIQKMFWTY